MKRITSLICTALILIIGGVYAAWTYSTMKFVTIDIEMAPSLQAHVSGTSSIGEFTLTNTVGISITDDINGEGQEGYDFKAEINWNGSLVYTFVPNKVGQENNNHVTYGVPLEMYIVIPTAKYLDKQIFTVNSDANAKYLNLLSPTLNETDISNSITSKTASAANEIGTFAKIANGEDVAFTWTITAAEIGNLINFYDDNLILNTKQEYLNFYNALTNANFGVYAGHQGTVSLPEGL